MDDIRVFRDIARRCYSQLRETGTVQERQALLRHMVEFWDRADELERCSPSLHDSPCRAAPSE